MHSRRILLFSPDAKLGKIASVALQAAGGRVERREADAVAEPADAELFVVQLDGAPADPRRQLLETAPTDTPIIAVLPRANLPVVVELMRTYERVAGLLVADPFEPQQLSAMATRVLAGDIFGLDKLVAWGTHIHSTLVGDYPEKIACISDISTFAEAMGVRRKYREAIEQCIDEMLMNALYDAPVDDQGRPMFADIPTKTRIALRVEQRVVVQYACDGKRFYVAVRDAFGTLERSTVLRYLHKCLHEEQQIDRKMGGAGLGLYLMASSSTQIYFNVLPRVATEATCVFDLERPKLALETFGFFVEKVDEAGRLAGLARRLPAGATHPVERRARARTEPAPVPAASNKLAAVLGVAIAVTLALIAVVAWPRMFGHRPAMPALTAQTIAHDAAIAPRVPPVPPVPLASRDASLQAVQDASVDSAPPVIAQSMLHVSANIPGTASVKGAPQCQNLPVPFDCAVAPGAYVVDLVVPQAAEISRKVTVEREPVAAAFELGYVTAPAGAQVKLVGGAPMAKVAMEAGPRRITVVDDEGEHEVMVTVRPGTTVVAKRP